MTIERKATRALLVGAALALGVSGCASWRANHMQDEQASSTSSIHRGPIQTADDAAITAKVKTAFAADELVKARNIDVDTKRGVVQLYGTVQSAAEKERAIQIARNVSGVVDVHEYLKMAG